MPGKRGRERAGNDGGGRGGACSCVPAGRRAKQERSCDRRTRKDLGRVLAWTCRLDKHHHSKTWIWMHHAANQDTRKIKVRTNSAVLPTCKTSPRNFIGRRIPDKGVLSPPIEGQWATAGRLGSPSHLDAVRPGSVGYIGVCGFMRRDIHRLSDVRKAPDVQMRNRPGSS